MKLEETKILACVNFGYFLVSFGVRLRFEKYMRSGEKHRQQAHTLVSDYVMNIYEGMKV
jgi:hypothetical protein